MNSSKLYRLTHQDFHHGLLKTQSVETRRFRAPEIFRAAVENARRELRRSVNKLAFSGIAGGITMGLTALGVGSLRALIGTRDWRDLVSYLVYPVGFSASLS